MPRYLTCLDGQFRLQELWKLLRVNVPLALDGEESVVLARKIVAFTFRQVCPVF